jgi:hypothetical protein
MHKQRTAAMNSPAGSNRKDGMPISGRCPVPTFTARIQRARGGEDETSRLRISVLRIAVRQAHTSLCLQPAVPDPKLSTVWRWATDTSVLDASVRRALTSRRRNGTSGSERRGHRAATGRQAPLLKGTGCGLVTAATVPPLLYDLTRRSMTDE